MGLDMYLYGKQYVWYNTQATVKLVREGKEIKVPDAPLKELVFEVGYWRKANSIHNWFVQHVQDGDDNCHEFYVSREQLQELLDLVNELLGKIKLVPGKVVNGHTFQNGEMVPMLEDGKTIANPEVCDEMLPSQRGFFFGGTDYDQYYYADLTETRDILTKALAMEQDIEFYYRASW